MKKQEDERLRFEQLISDLSAKFVRVSSDGVGPEIRRAITQIVRFFDFDRGEFGEFSEDNDSLLVVTYVGNKLFAVKWRNMKVHFAATEGTHSVVQTIASGS